MISHERVWAGTGSEFNLATEIDESLPLAIFIDDIDTFSEDWEHCFHVPGIVTMRPEIPKGLDEETRKERTEKVKKFISDITDDQLKRVTILVIDQFNDCTELFEAGKELIVRLRAVNNDFHILETCANFSDPIYFEDNPVLWLDSWETKELIRNSPPNAFMRITAFNMYSREAFLNAYHADPNNTSGDLNKKERRIRSLGKLMEKPYFQQVNILMGNFDDKFFRDKFDLLDSINQKLFLHYAWTIVGHMEIENGTEYYGRAALKLKELLGV